MKIVRTIWIICEKLCELVNKLTENTIEYFFEGLIYHCNKCKHRNYGSKKPKNCWACGSKLK